tara:strand:- start:2369 stop:3649 length:1281 start_codon:yes stop_codon:yes gene_type:complete
MRPLNRPMFKMGGPVKEGIMDGIREPKADGGTIGGGTIVGEDKGKGRTGYAIPLLAGIPAALTAARVAIPTALRAFGPAAARGFQAARTFQPGKLGFLGRTKDIFSVRGGLSAPMAGSRAEGLGFRLGSFARQNPFLTLSTPSLATTAVTAGGPAVLGAGKAIANFLVPGERFDPFKPEKPEEIVKKSNVGQVGKKGADTKVEKTGTDANQFDDDGTKKSTSVDRLLKGVVTRARRDAAADTAIEAGRQLRTGEMSIKDPSGAIDIASEKFDKVSDLQSKVDLARIENELKKQQIKEQALATDKYIRAASATGKPVDFVARKSLGIPTSISETTAIFEKAQPGFTKTNEGTQIVAKEWADTEGINFQGSLGGDDDLKKANKIEEFKLNPESFILEKIEELDGNNGLYVFGTNVFEYNNGVVKKIKN